MGLVVACFGVDDENGLDGVVDGTLFSCWNLLNSASKSSGWRVPPRRVLALVVEKNPEAVVVSGR